VADDGLPVTGAANIEFETIYAVRKRKIKGADGIFRRVEPCATMSEK